MNGDFMIEIVSSDNYCINSKLEEIDVVKIINGIKIEEYLEKCNFKYIEPLRVKLTDNVLDICCVLLNGLLKEKFEFNSKNTENLLKEIVKELDLKKYVKRINIIENNNKYDYVAEYNHTKKIVTLVDKRYDIGFYNQFNFICNFIHELEHAMQEKNIKEVGGSIKELILFNRLLKSFSNDNYTKNHNLYSTESDSEITSLYFIYKIEKLLLNRNKDLLFLDLLLNNLKENNNREEDKLNKLVKTLSYKEINSSIFNINQTNSIYYGLKLYKNTLKTINQSINNKELNEKTKLLLK